MLFRFLLCPNIKGQSQLNHFCNNYNGTTHKLQSSKFNTFKLNSNSSFIFYIIIDALNVDIYVYIVMGIEI